MSSLTSATSQIRANATLPILELSATTTTRRAQAIMTADDIATTKSQANYNCGGMDAIDYSQPGAQAYVDSVVDELASLGVDYIKLDGISNGDGADVEAWQAAIQQSGRPMVLNITQGSYTIKLAPTLQEYANQWEFAPDIELNGPDEGSADACNNPPYTGCLSVFPLTSTAPARRSPPPTSAC
jgi:hypothetical protein